MGRDCGFCKIAYAYLLSRAKHLENGSKAGQNLNMNRKSPDLKLRRSVLCVPASNDRALQKVISLDCDCIIFDLEDSVSPEAKSDAREKLIRFFEKNPTSRATRIIRMNSLESIYGLPDLNCVLSCKPGAVLLPKVERPQQIQELSDQISERDPMSEIRIWAMIETSRGVLNVAQIAESGPTQDARLDCLVVGLNDLRKDTKVPKRPGRTYLVPWLMQIVLAGRAFHLSVIDSVSNDFQNLADFEQEVIQGKEMGFDGKMLIHPAQIEPANRIFSPDRDSIEQARAIIAAFAEPSAEGQGAINLNGEMVERLHLEEAEALLSMVEMIERKGLLQ